MGSRSPPCRVPGRTAQRGAGVGGAPGPSAPRAVGRKKPERAPIFRRPRANQNVPFLSPRAQVTHCFPAPPPDEELDDGPYENRYEVRMVKALKEVR